MAKHDLSGSVLDKRYRLTERLAEGAMGVVYRAVSLTVDRPVAIKMMHASLPGEMAARERFQREAKLMALVDHPHCVSVIDYGLFERKPYLVMELVRGRSLHELLAEQRRVDVSRAADIIRQVLSGLAYAHEQGIIHRDIKPANVMVTPKAPLGVHVRILDFGLARLHAASTSLTDGLAVGTPSYMAPEQCRGDALDVRVDIYACGVVLFEMLTGHKPFVAADPIQIVKLQLQAPPPRLADVAEGDFGDALEAVIAKALAKRPDDRFASAIAMSDAIDAATAGRIAAPEATAAFPPEQISSDALVALESSVDVPITVGSSVVVSSSPAPKSQTREPTRLSRLLPVSRMRYVVLASVLVIAASTYAIVRMTSGSPDASAVAQIPEPAPPAPVVDTPPVDQHVAAATEAFATGKSYFAKMWWADGIKSFRDAIRLDPTYRTDPELIKIALRGFITTPDYDPRLGAFIAELGDAAEPALDETARTHPNPSVRARAAAQLRRSKR